MADSTAPNADGQPETKTLMIERVIADDNMNERPYRMVKDRYATCDEPFCFAYDYQGKEPQLTCKHYSQMSGVKKCDRAKIQR